MLGELIFRAYDIRGLADTELTDDVVEGIGHALGSMAAAEGARSFGVGRDCRVSGPRLREAMVRGLTKKEIAAELGLSIHTADFHLRHIYEKLHVNTRTGAVAKAVREKLTQG